MNNILNISPIDGRYYEKTKELNQYLSEYALIKYRIYVELKWLIFLKNNILKENIDEKKILNIYENFNVDEANLVKEKEQITHHDVKAVEYYLQDKFKEIKEDALIPFIHFAVTSEDINNISYNLMVKDALKAVYMPLLDKLLELIDNLAKNYADTAMLGHTHGQNATPTTVGKELKVFSYRINSIKEDLLNIKLRSKFSGATGNYNCHYVAYPNINWQKETKTFVESLDLEYNPLTTQIESHDYLCLLISHIKIINNIIKDLNSDCWLYISRNYFHEKVNNQEVGSSVMPHKVNPINHENSMANVEIANSLIDALVNNLSISRMQRDLSDSSKLRNLGVIFAHSIISIKETITGLNKIEVNKEYLLEELNSHYEILSEAIQTVLRKNNYPDAYDILKKLTRGKELTKEDYLEFVNNLDIQEEDKNNLLLLTPSTYLGISEELAK